MIFTLFYMYSTFVQWWRLGVLTNKINGTLNGKNALMICSGNCVSEPKFRRCLENLLFQKADRMGCIVVPRQKVNLQHWLHFPQDMIYFPIHFGRGRPNLASAKVFVLVQALLEKYTAHDADVVEIESFGEPIAWRVNSNFEIILKTDLEHVTKLVHCFSNGDIDINHDLRLLRVETVDVEGTPCSIKYENAFPVEQKLKYSCGEIHWRKFVATVKELYGKIYELSSRPKITIEKDRKIERVPVSEVKPIKKETKKDLETEEEKNTLAVRSRKSDHRVKAEKQHRGSGDRIREVKVDGHKSKSKEHHFHRVKEESKTKDKRTRKEVSSVSKELSDDIDGCYARAVKTSPSEIFARARDNGDIFEDCCSLPPSRKTGSQSTDTATLTDLFLDASGSGTVSLSKSADSEFYFSYDDETSLRDDMALPRQSVARTNLRNDLSVDTSPRRKGEAAAVPSCLLNRKPPNVLVYADSPVARENVKEVLNFVLNKEKYTIYDLPVSKAAATNFWDESTTLVVVCGNVTPTLTSELLQYLLTGGRLLCLCSDLLYSVLQTFSTAEVREHELVRFSYGDWKSIRMMHHIFCYQASPAKKQFSKDSDRSNHSSPVAPRTPSAVEIQHDGKSYVIQVQVLGTEETWQTPSLLLASVKDSEGTAIFSQVHLEIDPTQYQDDESKYAALTDSNRARLEILKHILSNHLDMDCANKSEDVVAYSYGYFLGRHDTKLKMLKECESIADNKLDNDKLSLIFCGKDTTPGTATSTRLPVLILSCPSNFSTVLYFETLQTQEIGRLVIYTDVLTSSQFILSRKLTHGLVVIPRQQTQGFGRSNNTWLSPEGCAMFSLQLHVPMKSTLGKSLLLTQHLVMTAIVSAVRSLPGYEKIELGLKWPNDLYAYSKIKVGGLLVTSQTITDVAVVNVGGGINLDNANPTTCINDVIKNYDTDLQKISYEKFFAIVFNEVERILGIVQNGDLQFLFDLYYKYWLHSGSEISVMTKEGHVRKVKIVGIDECGFLTVQTPDGRVSGVQPDGNTFDMLKGLIAPKIN